MSNGTQRYPIERSQKNEIYVYFYFAEIGKIKPNKGRYKVKTIIGVLVMVNHLKYQSRKYQGYQGRRAGWYLRRVDNKAGLQKSNRISLRNFLGRAF